MVMLTRGAGGAIAEVAPTVLNASLTSLVFDNVEDSSSTTTTASPTLSPSTRSPTHAPTQVPSSSPSSMPTAADATSRPTPPPTLQPTRSPSTAPTLYPTASPTSPTPQPSRWPSAAPTVPCDAGLVVKTTGFDAGEEGTARLYIHASKSTWDKNYGITSRARYRLTKPVSSSAVTFTVKIAGATRYAVMVLDDEDDDGKMDTNWIGVPSEGVGASRGASGGPFGGPKWSKAEFFVACGTVVEVQVELWKG